MSRHMARRTRASTSWVSAASEADLRVVARHESLLRRQRVRAALLLVAGGHEDLAPMLGIEPADLVLARLVHARLPAA